MIFCVNTIFNIFFIFFKIYFLKLNKRAFIINPMRILLLTDNQDLFYILNMLLLEKSSDNKCIVSDFSIKNILAHRNEVNDLSACIIYADHEDKFSPQNVSILSGIGGYLSAEKIPTYTNLSFITENNKIFADDNTISVESIDQLMELIEKNYSDLDDESTLRIAKRQLFQKGIPFTADCFGQFVAKNKLEIVNLFLKGGMSVDSKDDTGTPMLNIACRTDNFEFVKKFLDLGANIDSTSEDRGYTAVMDAVWRGNEKITRYLIENGAELNTINKEGQTNLILAVGANQENIVKLLADNGADPDIKDGMGMSAYTYATLFKKQRLVDILKPYHKC